MADDVLEGPVVDEGAFDVADAAGFDVADELVAFDFEFVEEATALVGEGLGVVVHGSDDHALALFAPDGPEGVADFAEGDAVFDAFEWRGHRPEFPSPLIFR